LHHPRAYTAGGRAEEQQFLAACGPRPALCSTKSCGFHCRPQLEGARQEHQFLRNEPADCESYWPSVEPYSSCPQLEGAREEQQFLRDETAELQARFSELYAEVKEAPNARAEQRAQRSVQEAERQVKSFGCYH